MTSAADILRSAGITTKSTAPGRYYAICPQCSADRKPAHQKLQCLGITIDEKGVTWGCNHCNWKGGGSYEPCPGKKNGGGLPFVAQYIYRQADSAPYLKVCRTAEKQFPQFHWDGSGWKKGKPNGPKIPYRLPELLAASVGTTIYFCEGEKDADAVHALGLLGTTCSEGAPNGWREELAPWFKDRHVVALPDNDLCGTQACSEGGKVPFRHRCECEDRRASRPERGPGCQRLPDARSSRREVHPAVQGGTVVGAEHGPRWGQG